MTPFSHYTYDGEEIIPEPALAEWCHRVLPNLPIAVNQITFIHCTDEELLEINREYLEHDYYTDIITFDLRENTSEPLEGDLFLSLDRITDNAKNLGITQEQELKRVMIHGILHLCGYGDKTPEDIALMREKENYFIAL